MDSCRYESFAWRYSRSWTKCTISAMRISISGASFCGEHCALVPTHAVTEELKERLQILRGLQVRCA